MKYLRTKGLCGFALFFLLLLLSFNSAEEAFAGVKAGSGELRGVWVASVLGIDYPSTATADDRELRREADIILDNVKELGFNAVFLQVRPCADALYKSDIFPWSRYLTGTQGLAPTNGFDPLAYFVEEAHKRGLELHAWINPYRITASPGDNATLAFNHPALKYPELTVLHTDGKLYFNPGEPDARRLIIDGIEEILLNYDVDGIHMDDYFYPSGDFDDQANFQKYGDGVSNIEDWRRISNNVLIKDIKATVKSLKPDVAFGVSPFGIWANQASNPMGSETRGNESYYSSYADTKLWVEAGYLDYIMPQIYWNIGFEIADYQKLLKWWSDVVADTGVKLYIGQAAYRVVDAEAGSPWADGQEIRRQVALNRADSNVSGYCMYTYNSFMKNAALAQVIKEINSAPTVTVSDAPASGLGKLIDSPPGDVFPDITALPQKADIEYVAGLGIIKGYDDGKFYPYANIKRGDFVLMLTRMFDLPIERGLSNFDDVKPGDYYYDEIATAKAKGLILGVDGVHFAPAANITNQDLYVMAYRALFQMGAVDGIADEALLERYTDSNQIADYARQAIAYFTKTGVLTQTSLTPDTITNRADAAVFIANVTRSKP